MFLFASHPNLTVRGPLFVIQIHASKAGRRLRLLQSRVRRGGGGAARLSAELPPVVFFGSGR